MKILVAVVLLMASDLIVLAKESPIGIALLRTQSWSPPTEISEAIPYTAAEDHTGYYTLTRPDGSRVKIEAGLIVQWVGIPRAATYANILSEQDLQPLSQQLNLLQITSTKVQATRDFLAPAIAEFQAEISMFRKGNKKIDGRWLSDAHYKQIKANELAQQEKEEADRVAQQAKEEADRAKHQANQDTMVAQNALKATTDLSEIEKVMAKLVLLKDKSPSAAQTVAEWNRDETSVSQWQKDQASFLDNIRTKQSSPFFKSFPTIATFDELHPETQQTLTKLDTDYKNLQQSLQFPQLLTRISRERQTVLAMNGIAAIVQKVKAQDVRGAFSQLNDTSNNCPTADRLVTDALKEMKKPLEKLVGDADQHQSEAQKLEALGKTSAAIKEYQQSFDLIKNDNLLQKIKQLREQSLGL